MKLTKETLREIIKEEIEKTLEISEAPVGAVASSATPPRRVPRGTGAGTPQVEPAAAAAPRGGETTMEIGQIEDIKSRLDQQIAQSGNQIVWQLAMALRILDKALGGKGEYKKARGTASDRRRKARAIATTGKGSSQNLGITGKQQTPGTP